MPLSMFDEQMIPNDLGKVDATIREFWGMRPLNDAKRAAHAD